MRKTLRVFWLLALAAVLTASVAAPALAAGRCRNGDHLGQPVTTKTDATCTKPGKIVTKCSNCGEVVKTEQIPAKGHKWGRWEVTREATCAVSGILTRTCSVCGGTEKKYESKLKTHKWDPWKTTKAATCTAEGSRTRVCSVCGEKETQKINALGHDWDEGVVSTLSGYLEEGVKIYTCKRCGAVKEEKIPVNQPMSGQSIMDLIRNKPPITTYSPGVPLIIVSQPVGGVLVRGSGETITLSVEASGGKEPYTYQWKQAYIGKSEWTEIGYENADNIAGATESEYHAGTGNLAYYCEVTDDNGKKALSDPANVYWNLRIAQNPMNTNMKGKDHVTLTCKAADGVPFDNGTYLYAWQDASGSSLGVSDTGTLDVYKEGEYFCVVQDSEEGLLTSKSAKVYSADPLFITGMDDFYNADPLAEITGTLEGGVAPFHVEWYYEGTSILDYTSDSRDLLIKAKVQGAYSVLVVDAVGVSRTADTNVYGPALTILHQPQGGELPRGGGSHDLELIIEGGTAPFEYQLMDVEPDFLLPLDSQVAQGHKAVFSVNYSGSFVIEVKDADGRFSRSNLAVVTDYDSVHIADCSATAIVGEPGGTARLFVKAEGGRMPYTYAWSVTPPEDHWNYTPLTGVFGDSTTSGLIGARYHCVVTDADGDEAEAGPMEVVYFGKLFISQQPQSVAISGDQVNPKATLTCQALSGTTESDQLIYQWYKKDGGWVLQDGQGPELSLKQTRTTPFSKQISGVYICVVTDPNTGEAVISNEATVAYKMKVDWAEQTTGQNELQLQISGGTAPYTCSITRRRIEPLRQYWGSNDWEWWPGDPVNIITEPYPLTASNAEIETKTGRYGIVLKNVELGQRETVIKWKLSPFPMQYVRGFFCWRYIFTVTDAMGEKITASVLCYGTAKNVKDGRIYGDVIEKGPDGEYVKWQQ